MHYVILFSIHLQEEMIEIRTKVNTKMQEMDMKMQEMETKIQEISIKKNIINLEDEICKIKYQIFNEKNPNTLK